jgi:hypothetical protein
MYHQLLDLLLKNVRSKATVATIEKKEEAKKKLYTQPCRGSQAELVSDQDQLWRPDGVLVRKMTVDIEESSDDVCKEIFKRLVIKLT